MSLLKNRRFRINKGKKVHVDSVTHQTGPVYWSLCGKLGSVNGGGWNKVRPTGDDIDCKLCLASIRARVDKE